MDRNMLGTESMRASSAEGMVRDRKGIVGFERRLRLIMVGYVMVGLVMVGLVMVGLVMVGLVVAEMLDLALVEEDAEVSAWFTVGRVWE